MFEFRSNGEFHPLRHQRDFILQEPAEKLQVPIGREKGNQRAIFHPILHQPIASAIDDSLSFATSKAVLKIEIVGFEVFGQLVGNIAPGAVKIHLHLQLRFLRKHMRPAAQRVLSIHLGVRQPTLQSARIKIALKRQCIGIARIPIRAKAALRHVPSVGSVVPVGKNRVVAIKTLAIDAVEKIRADGAAVTDRAKILQQ